MYLVIPCLWLARKTSACFLLFNFTTGFHQAHLKLPHIPLSEPEQALSLSSMFLHRLPTSTDTHVLVGAVGQVEAPLLGDELGSVWSWANVSPVTPMVQQLEIRSSIHSSQRESNMSCVFRGVDPTSADFSCCTSLRWWPLHSSEIACGDGEIAKVCSYKLGCFYITTKVLLWQIIYSVPWIDPQFNDYRNESVFCGLSMNFSVSLH